MEYVYAAMLLHKAGKKVDEASVKKVLEAAGTKADDGKVKSVVAALEGVDIEEAIKSAATVTAAPAPAQSSEGKAEQAPKKEEKKEEPKEEEAAAGLGSLFG